MMESVDLNEGAGMKGMEYMLPKFAGQPEKDDCTFLYWKGSKYNAGDKYTVTEDHTFVAQWEQNSGSDDPSDDSKSSSDKSKSGNETKTGDESHPLLWATLMALSMLVLASTLIVRRIRRN